MSGSSGLRKHDHSSAGQGGTVAGGGGAQFDDDVPALRFQTGYHRLGEIDPGTGRDAYLNLQSDQAKLVAGDGTDGADITIAGSAFSKAAIISVSDNSGADFSSVDIEPTSIDLFTAGPVTIEGAGVVFPRLTADPGSPVEGQTYMNTTTHKLRCWDGSAWQNLF
jgi:hypothetical protein